jgi:transposase
MKITRGYKAELDLNNKQKTELSWMYQVSKCAPQEALRNVDKAYDHFFRKVKLKKQSKFKGKVGFPKFKKKSRAIGSFRLTTGAMKVFSNAIQLPRVGKLRLSVLILASPRLRPVQIKLSLLIRVRSSTNSRSSNACNAPTRVSKKAQKTESNHVRN